MVQNTSPRIIEPLRSMETGGFSITERVHAPNWIFPTHAHESTLIGIPLEGFCTETVGRHAQECGAHSMQFLPAGEEHSYKFGRANTRCLTIDIKSQRLAEIGQFSKIFDHAIHVHDVVLSSLVTRLYYEFRLMDNVCVLTAEGLILEMLGLAERKNNFCTSRTEPLWLRRAKDFIHENAIEGVSLISVATLVEVHPTYLARTFRKFYHCSVGDYMRQQRLDHAVRELTKSNRSLAEIAHAAGFYDQSHLTHAFRRHMKMTPAEFRAAAQAK